MTANTLTITRTGHNHFTAEIAGQFSTHLMFDEALGVSACFIMGRAIPYLRDYPDWTRREKRCGGYVEPAALLPPPPREARQRQLGFGTATCAGGVRGILPAHPGNLR